MNEEYSILHGPALEPNLIIPHYHQFHHLHSPPDILES